MYLSLATWPGFLDELGVLQSRPTSSVALPSSPLTLPLQRTLVLRSMTTLPPSRHDGSTIRPPPAVGAGRDDLDLFGSVEISKQMPLSARVNPLNRVFVPRPLPEDIDDHFALPRALIARRALSPMSGATKGLCAAMLRRLDNIKDAHRRGAAKVGLAAQFNLSAMVLKMAKNEEPRGSSAAVDSHYAQASQLGTEVRPDAAACVKTASLCFRCQKARPVIAKPPHAPIKVHAKTISLARLPRGFEEIVDAVRDSWEVGDAKNVALKTLVQGSSKRDELAKLHPFGRKASSMVSKRRAFANAAQKLGGWDDLRVWLRRERADRLQRGQTFGYSEMQMFCSAFVRQ